VKNQLGWLEKRREASSRVLGEEKRTREALRRVTEEDNSGGRSEAPTWVLKELELVQYYSF
jgi:hypothetical protein